MGTHARKAVRWLAFSSTGMNISEGVNVSCIKVAFWLKALIQTCIVRGTPGLPLVLVLLRLLAPLLQLLLNLLQVGL